MGPSPLSTWMARLFHQVQVSGEALGCGDTAGAPRFCYTFLLTAFCARSFDASLGLERSVTAAVVCGYEQWENSGFWAILGEFVLLDAAMHRTRYQRRRAQD